MVNIIKKTRTFTVILIILFSSCSEKSSDIIHLDFWAMGAEGENVTRLIKIFEAENPSIKVTVQQVPWIAAHEKLVTAFVSETLPEVFQLGNTWIPEFKELGAVEELTSYLSASSTISPENYFQGTWDMNVLDSIVYGIPWYVDTRLLFYNREMLKNIGYDHPPRTWDELYQMSKAIKNKHGQANKYAFFIPTNEWVPYVVFGIQNGAGLLRDSNSYGDFSNKKFSEAFNFLMKFFHEGLAPKDMQQVMNVYQAYIEEIYCFYITGPWNVTEFKKRLPAELQNSLMTAPLPSPDDNYPGYSLAGGSSLVINKNSRHKNAAWKWIEFLSREQTQIQFYEIVSSLPAVKSAWQDSSILNNPYMHAFYVQLEKSKPTPQIPEWEQIVFAKIQQYAESAARNAMTVDEALRNLDKDTDQILEKRRWLLSR